MRQVVRPFAQPPSGAATISFTTADDLAAVREFVGAHAQASGLTAGRVPALKLAVSELVTNTLRHTAGGGVVRVWAEGDAIISELTDSGTFRRTTAEPAARPVASGGWGLYITGEVCDEFLYHSRPGRTVWRLVFKR
ncbi:ATP-binding protein [Catellatospora sichuanensis]|uniref:ATP-binding protein n=1 Tax=Catellatospora sichuanensis TaxID=1969805 RepID=UPI001FEC6EEB|nr:ATP-binding protein [Catellatospora sichuanensis]